MSNLIRFYDAYMKDDELMFSNISFNALQKINVNNGEVKTIDLFPGVSNEKKYLHVRVLNYKNRLYFIPRNSNAVHIWNIATEQWEDSIILRYPKNVLIEDAVLYQDEIWIFPGTLDNPIVRINLTSKMVEELSVLTKSISETVLEKVRIVPGCIDLKDDILLVAAYSGGHIFKINMKTLAIEKVLSYGNELILGVKVMLDGKYCIWFTDKSDIMVYDEENNKKFIINIKHRIPRGRLPFRTIIEIDSERFILLPRHAEEVLLINSKTGMVRQLALPNDFNRCSPYSLFDNSVKKDEKIYLFPSGGNKLLVINLDTMEISIKNYVVCDEDKKWATKILEKQFMDSFYDQNMNEAMGWNEVLPMFIDKVCLEHRQVEMKDAVKCGTKIYKVL